MARLFQRLEEACPPGEARRIGPNGTYELTDQFLAFKAECLARESRGRDEFGLRYLRRDNEREAREEWSDGAIYLALSSLKAVRDEGSDEDIDVVLVAMYHAFKAYEATLRLHARRHGAP